MTLLVYFTSALDRPCDQAGQSACSSPFPPGHGYMGPSWWAIGNESFGATITSFQADLYVPEAPGNLSGVVAINPAIENTVRLEAGRATFGISRKLSCGIEPGRFRR